MSPREDCGLTHTGNVRSNNEDAFHCDARHGLWVVADGMGGHEAGEVACAIVVETIRDAMEQGKSLAESIQLSHQAIIDSADRGLGARGMGSTVVAVQSKENRYLVAWVGDSRAYLWTRTDEHRGTLKQLSTDHSYVQMLIQAGAITPEQADVHPDRHVITQCLGSTELSMVRVDSVSGEWQDNQWLLLCSDGLTDELEDSLMEALLGNQHELGAAAQVLLQQALDCGGRDNTTLILIGQPQTEIGLWDAMMGWLKGNKD
jgi:serine/threonine protein phosphatase PrpC